MKKPVQTRGFELPDPTLLSKIAIWEPPTLLTYPSLVPTAALTSKDSNLPVQFGRLNVKPLVIVTIAFAKTKCALPAAVLLKIAVGLFKATY